MQLTSLHREIFRNRKLLRKLDLVKVVFIFSSFLDFSFLIKFFPAIAQDPGKCFEIKFFVLGFEIFFFLSGLTLILMSPAFSQVGSVFAY